ncbi:antibiotic biosynthesis monooxygenase [Oscillochloris sp. ZM17-4]|uniref:putative quinol monooxygenase n=1 Tax=Oscillochloris sp. ZM17-4 TaxID=2866714 RepID=UPI001C72C6CA|nr:antibiotic biosynthesis monooxygenase family protein [Oscillochloris sp. ZM17-4]MBX0329809.1 antibiotic biosynthesis monooxygenase [Oscillochloris sp. ZM17-4]
MIVLVARYTCKPGKGDAVLEALRRMVAAIAADEPGCPLFHVCRATDDPDRLMLYEHYLDDAALKAHSETAHFKAIILGEVVPMLDVRERSFYTLEVA